MTIKADFRAAFGARPGARVLNIVGASHKPYYDAYLQLVPDMPKRYSSNQPRVESSSNTLVATA